MSLVENIRRAASPLGDAIRIEDDLKVTIIDEAVVRQSIKPLVSAAVFGPLRPLTQWLIRVCAQEAGVILASIHDLYIARGRGLTRTDFTVPALNLRSLPYHAAKAVFRTARHMGAGAVIFEIARSEIGYTDQRPAEYASCILGAALAEGHRGPVFVQGDHFQVNVKRFAAEPEAETDAVRSLIQEAVAAGFFNIDIDTSTLVDLSKHSIAEQQRTNYSLSSEFTAFIRDIEPAGVTISVGGEIGEVGGHNSTEPELRAYVEGFNTELENLRPGSAGLSKISIQTGTSHGGVVLPDGSIAKVKIDFDTLRHLSGIAREEFGMAGAVQHGASTLPLEAFTRFGESTACEVHLATNFQNILYEHLPDGLRDEIYRFLDEQFPHERKPDQTDEQFYYKTRKRALGAFKRILWELPEEIRAAIEETWESRFQVLFERLGIAGTQAEVDEFIRAPVVPAAVETYSGESAVDEDVSDLAD